MYDAQSLGLGHFCLKDIGNNFLFFISTKHTIAFSSEISFIPSSTILKKIWYMLIYAMCTLHFGEDAYKPRSSPQLLKCLRFKKNYCAPKKDAVPTLKKLLEKLSATTGGKTRDSTVRRQQKKVRFLYTRVCKNTLCQCH